MYQAQDLFALEVHRRRVREAGQPTGQHERMLRALQGAARRERRAARHTALVARAAQFARWLRLGRPRVA